MNRALQDIRPSDTLAIAAKAKKLAADGIKVCNFAAGEPDFDTPASIKWGQVGRRRSRQVQYAQISRPALMCMSAVTSCP